MLTPKFKLTQNDESVTVVIHAPFGSLKDAEVNVEKSSFTFWAKPYLLKLKLSGELLAEDEGTSAVFDATSGDFTITMKKATNGEFFPNLDMLTTMKQPKGEAFKNGGPGKTLIELAEKPVGDLNDLLGETVDWEKIGGDDGEELPDLAGLSLSNYKYGFADSLRDNLDGLYEELLETCDIKHPHKKSYAQRSRERVKWENNHFDEGYYMQDAMETEVISNLLALKTPFQDLVGRLDSCSSVQEREDLVELSDKERDQMMQLPNKDFVFDDPATAKSAYLGLVDVLLAYCYNFRATGGESDVESPWNISRISSTLSWFDKFHSLKGVVIAGFRRMLCLPQFRNWDLNQKVVSDVVDVLKLGKKAVLKCLLNIIATFNAREPYYLLNRFYLSDYAVFVQRIPDGRLESLAEALSKVQVTKADIDLGLEACDMACRLALEEQEADTSGDEAIVDAVKRLNLSSGPRTGAVRKKQEKEELDSDDSEKDSSDEESGSSTSGASYVMDPCCEEYRDRGDCLCSRRAEGSISE